MTRQQYVNYLRQQADSLNSIADSIACKESVDDQAWMVDLPIVTEFDDEAKKEGSAA